MDLSFNLIPLLYSSSGPRSVGSVVKTAEEHNHGKLVKELQPPNRLSNGLLVQEYAYTVVYAHNELNQLGLGNILLKGVVETQRSNQVVKIHDSVNERIDTGTPRSSTVDFNQQDVTPDHWDRGVVINVKQR